MQLTRRNLLLSGLATAATLPFLRISAVAAEPAGTIRYGMSAYPSTLDPFTQTGVSGATITLSVYRGLVGYNLDGSLRGELAESWESDVEGNWTFKLREAHFHNGAPVTSADVKWTIEHAMAEESTAYMKVEMQRIASIETPDERTIVLRTDTPIAMLPEWFARPFMPVIAADSIGEDGLGVGAGPFKFDSIERGQSVVVVANPDFYRDEQPVAERIVFTAYADENLRVAAMEAGDVDIIEFVPWQFFEALENNPGVRLEVTPAHFMYALFNYNSKPFDDPRVRQAIGYAIKREDVGLAAFFGRAVPTLGFPATPGSAFHDAKFDNYWSYDPDKARSLLAEAGYPEGFSCRLLANQQYSMYSNTAVVVQQQLAEVGIRAELVLPDWATQLSSGRDGNYDIAIMGTLWEYLDADAWSLLLDGTLPPNMIRSFGMQDAEMDALLAAGRTEFDLAARKAIYDQVQQRALEMAPFVPFVQREQAYAVTTAVTGFSNLPGPLSNYSGATLETTSAG